MESSADDGKRFEAMDVALPKLLISRGGVWGGVAPRWTFPEGRRIYFSVFFDVFFERVFSGVREVFFSVLCGFWGPSGGHFWRYFQKVFVFLGNGGTLDFERQYSVLE